MINQVFNALGELDYEDFKKPVEEFLQEHKTEQERKKQRTRDERPVDASAEDDIEPNPAAAIEEEREDEDIDEDEDLGATHIKVPMISGFIRTPLGGFINHSEEPNCVLILTQDWDDYLVFNIITKRSIAKGEELLLDYET